MAYGAVLGQKPDLKNLESTVTISGNQPTALELENTAGSVNINFQAGSQSGIITYNTNDSFSIGANTAVAGNLSNTGTFTSQGNISTSGSITSTGAINSSSTINATSLITGRGFNASSQRITNVATPTTNTDGANKGYVDGKISTLNTNLSGKINQLEEEISEIGVNYFTNIFSTAVEEGDNFGQPINKQFNHYSNMWFNITVNAGGVGASDPIIRVNIGSQILFSIANRESNINLTRTFYVIIVSYHLYIFEVTENFEFIEAMTINSSNRVLDYLNIVSLNEATGVVTMYGR